MQTALEVMNNNVCILFTQNIILQVYSQEKYMQTIQLQGRI